MVSELKNARKITFKLREDVPSDIGTLIPGRYEKRYYSFSDKYEIEKYIAEFLESKYVPEEDTKFDLILYGKINEALLTMISLDIEEWDCIAGLVYIKPGDDTVRLLPKNDGFVWNVR